MKCAKVGAEMAARSSDDSGAEVAQRSSDHSGAEMADNCPVAATLNGTVLDPYATPQLCDRVIWLEDGLVRMEGNVAEVSEQYELPAEPMTE